MSGNGRRSIAACAGAVLAALVACSDKDAARSASTSSASGGEAVVLLDANSSGAWPAGLDPATNSTGGANLSLMNSIYGGLYQLTADPDGSHPRIVGVLASGYEIAENGRALIIRLRDGVRFSDGTLLDADAVKFNITRALTAPCACAPVRWPWVKEGAVTVSDARTVVLHFARPYGAAINGFPVSNINWIASPTALKQLGADEFRSRPVGAGPFKVVSNQTSAKLVLERNPYYWEKGHPYLDRLTFLATSSEQAAYLSLLAGDANAAEGITSTQLIAQALQEKKVQVVQQPATSPYVVQLNTTVPPLDDERAREALYYATDVEAIRKGLFNGWYPASQSFTASGGLFHHDAVPGYRGFDLARASALVKQIGGLNIKLGTLKTPVAEQVITALQSQWQKAGMTVTIETYDLATLVHEFVSHNWQAMLQTAGSYDPDAASGVSLRFRSGQIFSGVADAELDQVLLDAAGEVDPSRRDALYQQAAARISDRAYAPFLFAFRPAQLTTRGIEGPGLTTRIPPILISTAVLWQDVRLIRE